MTDLEPPQLTPLEGRVPVAPLVYPVYREEESVSLVELGSWFYADRRLAATLVALATGIALALGFVLPPTYRAEVLLAPATDEQDRGLPAVIGQLGELATLVGGLPGAGADRSAEFIARLRSRAAALAFIREHDLKRALFAERWDPQRKTWRAGVEVPSDLEAYRLFDEEVRHVSVERRSGLVTLAVEWRDPAQAAQWANGLVAEVNASARAAAIEEARRSIAYFERELHGISSIEVRQAVYRLIESQTKTMAIAAAREEYAFRVIDPALAPEKPSAPKPLYFALAGFSLGIVLAFALVLTKRAVRAWRAALEARGA